MFSFFERLIDPFRSDSRQELPGSMARFLVFFIRQAWGYFAILLVVSAIFGAIEVAAYYFVGKLVDLLAENSPDTLFMSEGYWLIFMLILFILVKPLSEAISVLIGEQTIVPSFFNLVRWQCHEVVTRKSYRFFQDEFAGRLATKVMQVGPAVGDFILNLVESIWFSVISTVLAIGLMAQIDNRLVLLFLGWFAFYLTFSLYIIPHIRVRAKALSEARSSLTGRIVDSYTNMHTVKLYSASGQEDIFLREGFEDSLGALRKMTRVEAVIRLVLSIGNDLFLVLMAGFGLYLWSIGEMTPGALAAALGLTLRITHMSSWMLWRINALFSNYGTAQNTMETIAADISQPEVTDRPDAITMPAVNGSIVFDRIDFAYNKDKPVIENFSLTIEPGEKVGLFGRSGAGKTTLVNLLLRLYDVDDGSISIGNQPIADVTQSSLRANMAMIAQEPSLLHRSIRDNIAYGCPDADEYAVILAAERAGAHTFITDLVDPKGREGYDSHVGERGVKLSGGQRQRIALARVFLRNAPILLLDEATSALDSESESVIQSQLQALFEGKTVIAIAHRLSTICIMDRLIVLDEGRIIESGRHGELLKLGGLYAKMWEHQSTATIGS